MELSSIVILLQLALQLLTLSANSGNIQLQNQTQIIVAQAVSQAQEALIKLSKPIIPIIPISEDQVSLGGYIDEPAKIETATSTPIELAPKKDIKTGYIYDKQISLSDSLSMVSGTCNLSIENNKFIWKVHTGYSPLDNKNGQNTGEILGLSKRGTAPEWVLVSKVDSGIGTNVISQDSLPLSPLFLPREMTDFKLVYPDGTMCSMSIPVNQ